MLYAHLGGQPALNAYSALFTHLTRARQEPAQPMTVLPRS